MGRQKKREERQRGKLREPITHLISEKTWGFAWWLRVKGEKWLNPGEGARKKGGGKKVTQHFRWVVGPQDLTEYVQSGEEVKGGGGMTGKNGKVLFKSGRKKFRGRTISQKAGREEGLDGGPRGGRVFSLYVPTRKQVRRGTVPRQGGEGVKRGSFGETKISRQFPFTLFGVAAILVNEWRE